MAKAKRLPSGNWRVLVYAGKDASGKRVYESFTAPTKNEAEYLASEYKVKRPARNEEITLREAYERYINSKSAVLSPSTILGYKKHQRNDFPSLMDIPLKKINQEKIQIAINEASTSHSPKTVHNMHGLLSAVLGIYRPDLTLHTLLPQKKKHEVCIPEEEEIKKIYDALRGLPMELPFLLASQLGLRASEIAGLQYKNVNREKGEITVCQARVKGEKDGVQGNILKSPKSYAGERTLPCPKYILDIMDPEGHSESDYVSRYNSGAITKNWLRSMEKIDCRYFNFHALRHYFASKALLMGIPKKYVAELMGHASEHMLDAVYEHTFKEAKNKYSNILVGASEQFHKSI